MDERSLHSFWGLLVHPRAHRLITSHPIQQQCLSCNAEASPVLEEATAAADLPEPSAADAPAPEAAQEPKIVDPVIQEFTDLFAALSTELQGRGYYQDRPEYTVPNKSRSELGVEKRALLTMARERIDILYSLPTDKLNAIASNELPYVDRKVLLSPQFCCNQQPASEHMYHQRCWCLAQPAMALCHAGQKVLHAVRCRDMTS